MDPLRSASLVNFALRRVAFGWRAGMNQIHNRLSKDESRAFNASQKRRNRLTLVYLLIFVALIFTIGFIHIRGELALARDATVNTEP